MIKKIKLGFCLALLVGLSGTSVMAQEVNVYSARKEALIKPLLDKFTDQTGIQVNLVTGKADALITRMQSEGAFSPADLLLTTDVGRLVRAKQQNLTQPVSSATMNSFVPAKLRDNQGHWFALTMRARPIMYAPDRVNPANLSGMDELTEQQWQGRVCIRSSGNIYNQSMVAAMIESQGQAKTSEWAKGMVANFARPPKGGDRDQIKAVAAGQCDIAIANTYYLAGMLVDGDSNSRAAAEKVKVFWPDQNEQGTHVNISGAAVAKNSPNPEAAVALLEYMISEQAQAWYATANHEYPIRDGVAWSDILTGFGTFKAQQIDLYRVGDLNSQALKLMDAAGWK